MKKALIVIIIMISLVIAIRKPLTVKKMCQWANQALSHSEDLCAHFTSLLTLIDLGRRMVAQWVKTTPKKTFLLLLYFCLKLSTLNFVNFKTIQYTKGVHSLKYSVVLINFFRKVFQKYKCFLYLNSYLFQKYELWKSYKMVIKLLPERRSAHLCLSV